MSALETLARSLVETQPEAAAHALEALAAEEAAQVLDSLPHASVGPVVERLMPHTAAAILERVGHEYLQELLAAMTPRQAALVLHHLSPEKREAALDGLPERKARELREHLRYPPHTAGGIMEPQVTTLPVDLDVEEAVAVLRRAPRDTLYYLYVTDRDGHLVGVLNMRELLLAPPRTPLRDLVRTAVMSIAATEDREEVVAQMQKRRLLALPVVDPEGRFIGVVRHDQALDAVQQEAFEDLQKMVGAGGDERALSPVSVVVRKRLPWLYVNLLTAFLAASVVGIFEDIVARFTALAVLLPIVSGQGGNSGAQTLAVVMRGLALREILPGAARRILIKEVVAALLNGVLIAVVTAGAVYLWSHSVGLALVIGVSMVANMLVASIAGACIPLILRALGRDPAQSSAIFLTTITDVFGFASFLGLATLLSGLLG